MMLAFLGACVAPEQQTTCKAANWQEFVGQPETAVYGVLPNLRVVHAGEAITKDYNPDRLNAEVAADGTITRFACY